ncbi:hypothetical protein BHM03_00000456 [Ensete ventricosum]|uniref:Protein kinase domain-containing protein n=1 Tax=Ensete ventricosum TaxID=4639 RepID=A0A427AX42_ENSVE|nr:hypothetical protein B296_00006898 [Ensete ventricosum]RZR75874.1 hypothetical protein BHM03_00000456 [Ensete ventricosum]
MLHLYSDGVFFAIKEVLLLDQGINAPQCILQLEQEVALLRQFEHENIVQYYGTDKTQALFKIGRGERPPIPNYLSRDARDFISQCVKVNPVDRPSASQLLEHPFVKRSLPISTDSKSSWHLHKEI